METINVEVQGVSKEAYEMAMAMVDFISTVKKSLADGYQTTDIPMIIGAMITDFANKMDKFMHLPSDIKDNPEAFIKAWIIGGMNLFEQFR